MDSELIYTKTASGEEAMYQRTRVMQRNVRMILILVDGQSTVADLCVKTGNRQLTESALADLEKGGFIELRVEQDSIWAESKKVAQEIRAAAIDKALQLSKSKETPRSSTVEMSEPSVPIQHSMSTPLPRGSSSGQQVSQFSLAPGVYKPTSGESVFSETSQFRSKGDKSSTRGRENMRGRGHMRFWLERIRAWCNRPQQRLQDKPSVAVLRRRPRSVIGWPSIAAYGIVSIVALTFAVINYFPFARYLPDLESALSQMSGQPVKIGEVRGEVYPKPGLFLNSVRFGLGKNEIRIAEIRLQPDIFSIGDSKKIFSEVVLHGISLSPVLVSALPEVFSRTSRADSSVIVKHVRLENVEVSFGNFSLPNMDGEIRLSSTYSFRSLALWLPDHTVNLDVKPQGQKIDVVAEGIAWRPAQASSIFVDSFSLNGIISSDAFTISDLELHTLDGVIKARGVAVQRADKILSLSGDLSFERINATRLGEAFGIGTQFSGETAGKLSFSSIADSGSSLFSTISGEGGFTIRRGSVREIDLVETVRRASSSPVMGGSTSFDQLGGKIKLSPTTSMFSDLVLNSGLMQATGYLEVGKDFETSGRIDLQMRGSVNQSRVPITIKGPLKAPALQLGRAK